MSMIKFVACDGKWISSDIVPENACTTYYAVTLCQIESRFNMLSNEYWRYFHNRWQYYHDGEWLTTWNPLFKVVAYQKITDIEAAPYEQFHAM